jgi:murein L,D-transpeptidase YafK
MTDNKYKTTMYCICIVLLLLGAWPVAADDVRVRVDTQQQRLTVLQGDRTVMTIEDIAIGRYGTTPDKRRGDNMTPLGHFRVGWITDETRFHLFMGLDFPTSAMAERAYREGAITKTQWQAIRRAAHARAVPPQNTPLGGYLGIHGLGKGDPDMHASYNWTNGCVAVTNEQIERLAEWVHIGTPVDIE